MELSDAQWRERLSPEEFSVLRSSAPAAVLRHAARQQAKPALRCAGCGLPLFSSDAKFHSRHRLAEFLSAIAPGTWPKKGLQPRHGAVGNQLRPAATAIWATSSTMGRTQPVCDSA